MSLAALLLFVDFLDEAAGVSFVGLPDLQRDFGLGAATALAVTITLPGLLAACVEPALMVWADRRPRARKALVVTGLLAMSLGLVGAAVASGPWTFTLAMAVMFVGNGLGVNLAQATLMDADPERRELWMTRWVVMGTLGDLGAPLLVGALGAAALGWRWGLLTVGAGVAAHALWLARRPFPEAIDLDDDDDEPSWREALTDALSNRALLTWSAAVATCGLLDELFVALASSWLAERFGATLAERGLVLGLATAGGLVGLGTLELALRRGVDPQRWLTGVGIATVGGLALWLAAPTLWISAAALFVLEVLVAQLYPIAQAQAYRALPGRSAMVEAVGGLFAPVDVLAPLLIGLVADRLGLGPALALLALQPLALAWVARGPLRRAG